MKKIFAIITTISLLLPQIVYGQAAVPAEQPTVEWNANNVETLYPVPEIPYGYRDNGTKKVPLMETINPETYDYIANEDYMDSIYTSAEEFNLDPKLLMAMVAVESGGINGLVGTQGAVGLMGIMPSDPQNISQWPTDYSAEDFIAMFKDQPTTKELQDTNFNIYTGARILSDKLDMYDNDLIQAIKSYGPEHYQPNEYDFNYSYKDKNGNPATDSYYYYAYKVLMTYKSISAAAGKLGIKETTLTRLLKKNPLGNPLKSTKGKITLGTKTTKAKNPKDLKKEFEAFLIKLSEKGVTKGDSVFTILKDSPTLEKKFDPRPPELLNGEQIKKIFGNVSIANANWKYPNNEKNAIRLEKSLAYLTPEDVQKNTISGKNNDSTNQTTARLCIKNKSGKIINETISETKFTTESKNPGKTNEYIQSSKLLNSFIGQDTKTLKKGKYDFTLPPLKIKIEEPLPCEEPFIGFNLQQKPEKSIGLNKFFDEPPKVDNLLKTGEEEITSIIDGILKFFGWKGFYQYTIEYIATGLNPNAARKFCSTYKCTTEDLKKVNYIVPERTAGALGGFVNTMMPDGHTLVDEKNGGPVGDVKQEFEIEGKGVDKADTAVSFEKIINEGNCYMNCMLLPNDKKYLIKEECGDCKSFIKQAKTGF